MIHMTSQNIKISQPTAVAIGKFDGVHRGHMALLDELKLVASYRGLAPLVLTFDPHPIAFFKRARLPLILDPFEKVSLFETLGIDYYLEYRFDEQFAKTEPEDFLYNVVHKKLNARALVVAEGYRFGRGGAGDVSLLRRVCGGLGIEVQEIGHVVHEGHK
ncbi:MAG: riboflavin biosynthesis protein RibF, partial [Defluviitaleaceae bacterium]|nr:riboflavin biosynthesis protein RibF [Defluviitaleaceae bacterium]